MKKFLGLIIIFFICIFFAGFCPANSNEKDYIELGNSFLNQIENNQTPELNSMYINKALYYFYVASKSTPPSTDSLIGLGRVYMIMDKKEDAKNTLFRAYSVDKYNADANFYFGEFCYKYDDFESAMKYYENALNLGYKDRTKNLERLISCYSKLGDTDKIEKLQK